MIYHVGNISALITVYMVKGKNNWVGLPTVNTEMGFKIAVDESLCCPFSFYLGLKVSLFSRHYLPLVQRYEPFLFPVLIAWQFWQTT